MADRDNVLELISTVTELNDLHEFMQDEVLDEALSDIIRLIANPDVPIYKVPNLVVKLQAIAAQCSIKAKVYQTINKGNTKEEVQANAHRKNLYYTIAEEIDKLVSALKYFVK
jgi:hypothetical protein